MKNILVPTDFSDTARNAMRYAADLACFLKAERIILYNAYSMPLTTEMTWALVESEEMKKASLAGLEESRMLLKPFCGKDITIDILSDFGFLAQRINDVAQQVHADMIVMGITGGGKLEQALIGSNAITVVHSTHIPVLIVPNKTAWKPVENIAWACDHRQVMETTPMDVIKQMLQLTKAKLHVIHNDPKFNKYDPLILEEDIHIADVFKGMDPIFDLMDKPDLSDGVNEYVAKHAIDWLIVIPKKHSWLATIFSKSHTKELAFHTHVPMLCLQQ